MVIFRGSRSSLWMLAVALCIPGSQLAAQPIPQGNPGVDRYIRLDDGLYELNADGTYHKVNNNSAASLGISSSSSRPSATPSSGRYTGHERFMRFDDGLYERMADGTYTKVDERRQMQQQSQSGRYGSSSTSMDPHWHQHYGRQEYWDNQPQPWSNNSRPPQWNSNRPPPAPFAVDNMLMNQMGQDKKVYAPNPMVQPGSRPPRPPAVDSMLMNGTGQGVTARAREENPWYNLGRSIRGAIEAEAQRGRRGR